MTCGCCGRQATTVLLRTLDRDNNVIEVYHCKTCCALTPEYGTSAKGLSAQVKFHEQYWGGESVEDLQQAVADMDGLLRFYSTYLSNIGNGIVFEIGVGRGNLLAALLRSGFNAYGCEPSTTLSRRARSLLSIPDDRLLTCSAEEFISIHESDEGRVKAVFLWHVIEHLEEPLTTLRNLCRLLSEDAVIIGQGPMLCPWYIYPEHRFFHTESNIAWLAKELGMNLLWMESQSAERFASFVMGGKARVDTPMEFPLLTSPDDATGSLYFTLSHALRRLDQRFSELRAAANDESLDAGDGG